MPQRLLERLVRLLKVEKLLLKVEKLLLKVEKLLLKKPRLRHLLRVVGKLQLRVVVSLSSKI
jgi:hypothetical protein